MRTWTVRRFEERDLDAAVVHWASAGATPPFPIGEVVAAVRDAGPAWCAVEGDRIVGAVVARVEGAQAWVLRLSVVDRSADGPGAALVDRLLADLTDRGVGRVTGLLPEGAVPTAVLDGWVSAASRSSCSNATWTAHRTPRRSCAGSGAASSRTGSGTASPAWPGRRR